MPAYWLSPIKVVVGLRGLMVNGVVHEERLPFEWILFFKWNGSSWWNVFGKKVITFRGISFFSLFPEFSEISVPFVHTYRCQVPHDSTYEKECLRSETWW